MPKFYTRFLSAALILISAANADAGVYKTGKVQYMRIHDAAILPGWAPPIFWFTLTGVNSVANSPLWNGHVLFVSSSQQSFSMVMAAQLAEKEVGVYVDETRRHPDGWCMAGYITNGNPPPSVP